MKPIAVATIIGDVVDSRGARDRAALHHALSAALERVNDELAPLRALRVTVGDEYQGCFHTVGRAVAATLLLRLALAPGIDVRHGLGWGSVQRLDDQVEDGPGWWAAREAIEAVKHGAAGSARSRRTAYADHSGDAQHPGPSPAAVNAALLLRDAVLARADERSLSVLRGLLGGMSQKAIAAGLGISPSAVSQRIRNDSLGAILASHTLMEEIQ